MKKPQYYFTENDPSPFYVDLRQQQDDTFVLENPHRGWYLHYVDNGLRRGKYRDDLTSPQQVCAVPGLKYLYLRLDWADIEPAEGQFDFSFIRKTMDTYGKLGLKFMFRFCCYEYCDNCFYATPQWVFDKGIGYTQVGDDREPDYGDQLFLHYLDRFLHRVGEELDGNPLVETVDIGTFGTWGEGHTWRGSMKNFSFDTLKAHIDLHRRAFPHTHLTLNYGMLTHIYDQDRDKALWLADYCVALGCGLRNDSINVFSYTQDYNYDTLSAPDLFAHYNDRVPVDIEFEHYGEYGTETFRNAYPHIEALRHTGATYAGFHTYLTRWLPEQKDAHEYIANRLGYWYFFVGYSLPPLLSDCPATLSLWVENRGFAKAYYPYSMRIRLAGDSETYTVGNQPAQNTLWEAGTVSKTDYSLNLTGVPAGTYRLEVGLFEGDTPIAFGMSPERKTSDGFYRLGEVTAE